MGNNYVAFLMEFEGIPSIPSSDNPTMTPAEFEELYAQFTFRNGEVVNILELTPSTYSIIVKVNEPEDLLFAPPAGFGAGGALANKANGAEIRFISLHEFDNTRIDKNQSYNFRNEFIPYLTLEDVSPKTNPVNPREGEFMLKFTDKSNQPLQIGAAINVQIRE